MTWQSGDPAPAELSRISVFDGHAARLYVDEERRVEFLPHDLDLLTKFAAAITALLNRFRNAEAALTKEVKPPLPSGFTPGTSVSNLLTRLRPGGEDLPSPAEVEQLATWSDGLEAQLQRAEDEVRQDPASLVTEVSLTRERLTALAKHMEEVSAVLGEDGCKHLKELYDRAQSAKELASKTAAALFAQEPIPSLGSEAWRRMLIYARDFAVEAFPDGPDPKLTRSGKCVLCHQDLDSEAGERLQRFDRYLEDRAAQDAEEAKALFVEAARKVRDLKLRPAAEVESLIKALNGLGPECASLATAVSAFFDAAPGRHATLGEIIQSKAYGHLAALESFPPAPDASGVLNALATRGADLEREARTGDSTARIAAHAELSDRKKLSTEVSLIIARLKALWRLRQVVACRDACNTTQITNFVNALRERTLTESLRSNLEDEIEALDLDHLPIRLRERGDHGASKVQINLETKVRIPARDVLSEGEQRALALAGFLAELKEIGSAHGIIVDDPVSSLDHARTETVARRLVQEGFQRQVIIFTHSLIFHHAVIASAKEQAVPVHREYISRNANGQFGIIEDTTAPWPLAKVSKRLHLIEGELRLLKKDYDHFEERCRPAVRHIYTLLRETWERLVEEVLFADVIGRFRPDVATMKLRAVEVGEDDRKAVYQGMSRCSRYSGHDQASGASPDLPPIEEIEQDLGFLTDFYQSRDRRRSELEKAGKSAEKDPPSPQLLC
ncbi:AAA family ATPase [Enterovirga sp. CN4-39]|uniref:AAA family ATPase n=1 Tax=Enterovirga sp. CN4-39 TaxID=3400910 RepID=UPI003C0A2B6A